MPTKIDKTNHVLGTAIKIVSVIDETVPDTITVTILDPSEVEIVENVNMTKETDQVYYYVWQSDINDDEGLYTAVIKVTSGNYTSISYQEFEMIDVLD